MESLNPAVLLPVLKDIAIYNIIVFLSIKKNGKYMLITLHIIRITWLDQDGRFFFRTRFASVNSVNSACIFGYGQYF